MNRLILRPISLRRPPIKSLIAPALLVGAALLQTTISPFIKINGVHPDLVLIVVVSWVILRGFEEGAIWALIGGLSLDVTSGAPFGIFSLAMMIAALVAGFSHGRVVGSSIVLPVGLIFPLSLLFNGLALLALNLVGRPVVWMAAFSDVLLPLAFFNTAVMVVVFPLLHLLNRSLYPQPLSL